jgi:hypothetical protein
MNWLDTDMAKYGNFYREHHRSTPYGRSGRNRINIIAARLHPEVHTTVLDWGAGSQFMARALEDEDRGFEITSYDAYVDGIDTPPEGTFDVVITTDVLEHIPYEEIDEVLDEIIGYTGTRGIHYIPSFPAQLVLPDGTNAHIIQENAEWWKDKFEQHGVNVTEAKDIKRAGTNQSAALIVFERT